MALRRASIVAACLVALLATQIAPSAARPLRANGRCAHVTKATDPLVVVCRPLTDYVLARRFWDAGFVRLKRKYGFDPRHQSAEGRTAWRSLTQKAGSMLEIDEELCSPRRGKLRARLATGDQLVMLRICTAVVDTLDFYRIYFIDYSERRAPDARETKALSAIVAHLKKNKPLLQEALSAVSPL